MKAAAWILCGLLVVALLGLIGYLVWNDYVFGRDCAGYLKLAGDAPTIERANEFLGKAVSYLARTGKTEGSSAIIFRTPKADVGIWYGQIVAAKKNLAQLLEKGEAASQLEKDNSLMKIRETVLDQGEAGTKVTSPPNISIYPRQRLLAVLLLLWLVAAGVNGILFWKVYD